MRRRRRPRPIGRAPSGIWDRSGARPRIPNPDHHFCSGPVAGDEFGSRQRPATGPDWPVPDHPALCRRQARIAVQIPTREGIQTVTADSAYETRIAMRRSSSRLRSRSGLSSGRWPSCPRPRSVAMGARNTDKIICPAWDTPAERVEHGDGTGKRKSRMSVGPLQRMTALPSRGVYVSGQAI